VGGRSVGICSPCLRPVHTISTLAIEIQAPQACKTSLLLSALLYQIKGCAPALGEQKMVPELPIFLSSILLVADHLNTKDRKIAPSEDPLFQFQRHVSVNIHRFGKEKLDSMLMMI